MVFPHGERQSESSDLKLDWMTCYIVEPFLRIVRRKVWFKYLFSFCWIPLFVVVWEWKPDACYLCFDQITKNMEYLTQYLFYPLKWGENMRKRNYQCSLRTLLISLPKGVPWERRLMVINGEPETLSLYWLWAILGPCESGISPIHQDHCPFPSSWHSLLMLLNFPKPKELYLTQQFQFVFCNWKLFKLKELYSAIQ